MHSIEPVIFAVETEMATAFAVAVKVAAAVAVADADAVAFLLGTVRHARHVL